MMVWGFTAGLLDAVLEAAGLDQPWDDRDVRPLAVLPAPAVDEADDPVDSDLADRAAPTVVDDTGQPGSPRTVRLIMSTTLPGAASAPADAGRPRAAGCWPACS